MKQFTAKIEMGTSRSWRTLWLRRSTRYITVSYELGSDAVASKVMFMEDTHGK